MEDPRDELLHDINPDGREIEVHHCPEIKILIENLQVEALVDTGSEITAMSEEFYYQHSEIFRTCPTLPISGKMIKGATGSKSARLKIQVLLKTTFANLCEKIIFIVIPKLIKPCIIGYDTVKSLKMLIDTVNRQILFSIKNNDGVISYAD